jgi:hypothetical protein
MNNIKELLTEWLLTFSDKKSWLSSKRLERFALFVVALGASAYFLFKGIYNWEITSTDLIIVTATLFGYAGFATIQGKKDENNQN